MEFSFSSPVIHRSLLVRVCASKLMHPVCMYHSAGAQVAFFPTLFLRLGGNPETGRVTEQFDFLISSCDLIYVMCFPQIPSKYKLFPIAPHPNPIWTPSTPPHFLYKPKKLSCILLFFCLRSSSPCTSTLSLRPSQPGCNCCNECVSDKKKSRV